MINTIFNREDIRFFNLFNLFFFANKENIDENFIEKCIDIIDKCA